MLDLIRVIASGVVAYGHLTQNYFSTGWQDRTNLARNAVAIFFVLSGFVIRYVTTQRPTTFAHYLGDRASRIYSIAIPALLLTLVTDTIARHINPTFHTPWSGAYSHPLLRIAINLIFCGQLWTHIVTPLSNSPYWSVNYEVAYYLLYGCFFYLTGLKRWLALAAICLLNGPRVLYLAPLWIAGCILHDLYQHWNAAGTTAVRLTWASLLCLPLLALLSYAPPITAVLNTSFAQHFVGLINSVGIRPAEYIFGIAWTVIFLWLLHLARQITLAPNTPFVRTTRFIAEGTFPIYLLHFPLYVLIAACIPYNHASALHKITIFFSVLTLGILAGHPGNILKIKLRSLSFSSLWKKREVPVNLPALDRRTR